MRWPPEAEEFDAANPDRRGTFALAAVSLADIRLHPNFDGVLGGLDLLALLAAPMVLAGVAALATYLPARRASRIDPVQALRTE